MSVSVSGLTVAAMLESGYDADAWCRLSRYKSLWANINIKADARCDGNHCSKFKMSSVCSVGPYFKNNFSKIWKKLQQEQQFFG